MILKNSQRRAGFTLIELLVVVGLISLLAGIIGIAMKGGDSGTALKGAQSTIFSLVASARGQAILNQGTARLVVYANSADSTQNLRYLQVFYTSDTTPSASSTWTAAGDGVTLPTGVYVVPSGTANFTNGAGASTYSLLSTDAAFPVTSTTKINVYYVQFSQLGTPAKFTVNSSDTYGRIVVSTAVPDPTSSPALQPKFDNPLNVRGLLIRQLGSSTLLNSADDFE